MKNTITTSIIILTHNNLESYTKPCISTLLSTISLGPCELIIVDNGSTDATPLWLTALAQESPFISCILNPSNLGFAAGNNQGLRAAKGSISILLNNDTLLPQGWLEPLLTPFACDPTLGILGPVTNSIGSPQEIVLPMADPSMPWEKAASSYMSNHKDSITYVPKICFFCVALSKACIDRVGLLDESFIYGNFEDDDFCTRVLTHQMRVAYTDASFVWHRGGATLSLLSKQTYAHAWYSNKRHYIKKHGAVPLIAHDAQTLLDVLSQDIHHALLTNDLLLLERSYAHMPYVQKVVQQLQTLERESQTAKGSFLRLLRHLDGTYTDSFFTTLLHKLHSMRTL